MTDKSTPAYPVYKRVNGELVRIPGDVRDPSRRYAGFFDTPSEKMYVVEYTEEEEKRADEEAARWEAEKPQREAEERRQQEEAAKFRDSLIYENRLVVFLDVLGWKNAISDSVTDEGLTKKLGVSLNNVQNHCQSLENQRNFFAKFGHELQEDTQLTHFSDSIVISVKSSGRSGRNLLWILKVIVEQLLDLGFFVRGGISFGKLIHRNSIVYGPALIKAYELELSAIYPRIILQPELAQIWGRGDSYGDKKGQLRGYDKSWRQDSDGMSFFDFLQPFGAQTFDNDNQIRQSFATHLLTTTRPIIISNLQKHEQNPKIFSKYLWLSNYFNEVCDEYPNSQVEKIKIGFLTRIRHASHKI